MSLEITSWFTEAKKLIYGYLTVLFSMMVGAFTEKHNPRQRISKQRALDELRVIRESGLRENEKVVDLWKMSLRDCINKLGYEKYTILEQVFIAALDVGDEDLACECLDHLLAKFRNSSRVNRLFGMYLESKGNFEDAQTIYAKLIKDDPTNTLARKRMITILKAQQRIPEAINELREYLKIFMSDFEAWNELADLYLSEGDYKHAAFCLEEMILSNPSNHLYCQRYAEIKYTEGGTENLELARAYYTQACLLCPNNLRSLYGLLLTCSALDHHLTKSIGMLSLTADNKQQNGPCTTNTYTSASSNIIDGNLNANHHPHHHHHQSNHSRMNTNSQSLLKQQQQQQSTGGFSAISPSLSNTEKNRQLARWAAEQIRLVYMSANRNPEVLSSSTKCCVKSSPKRVLNQPTPKKPIQRTTVTPKSDNANIPPSPQPPSPDHVNMNYPTDDGDNKNTETVDSDSASDGDDADDGDDNNDVDADASLDTPTDSDHSDRNDEDCDNNNNNKKNK
ncbi:unnamed protein product [Trichobilharzia szidati]|nr:unnamed protein product [Trichobilharzia szidati]